MPGPYLLEESTWRMVRDAPYEVAVLPWGATEPHNFHLPHGTDTLSAERIAALAAARAWERGAKVVVLPAVPFGANAGQIELRGTLNLNPSTQAALLADLADSLVRQSIPKMVILNGHGGNDFCPMVRELQGKSPLFICVADSYGCVDGKDFFENPGDHGGEQETSVMMHLFPDLVRPLSEAGRGRTRPFRIEALREGWAWAPRDWKRHTEDTGAGDPSGASAEKGKRFVEAVVARLSNFLAELAATPLTELYGDP